MAKRLFYVSAALLCSVITYHLGARSAGAQAGNQLSAGIVTGFQNELYAATPAGQVLVHVVGDPPSVWIPWRNVGATSPVVAIGVRPDAGLVNPIVTVFCQDGTVYDCPGSEGPCTVSNVFGGPTPAAKSTWGELKMRYR